MAAKEADKLTEYLIDEINTNTATIHQLKRETRYKQLGIEYIAACKELATGADFTIDKVLLKQLIMDAINLLQSYHDAVL